MAAPTARLQPPAIAACGPRAAGDGVPSPLRRRREQPAAAGRRYPASRRQRPAPARRTPGPALTPCGARHGGGAAGAGSGPTAAVPVCPPAGEAARARLRGRVGGGKVCRGPPPSRCRLFFPRRGGRRRLRAPAAAGKRGVSSAQALAGRGRVRRPHRGPPPSPGGGGLPAAATGVTLQASPGARCIRMLTTTELEINIVISPFSSHSLLWGRVGSSGDSLGYVLCM